MRITLKLFATLARHLPACEAPNVARIDVEEGATVGQVLDSLGVPRAQVHMVLLDGHFVPLEELDARMLKPGQALAVWPPVAGG